MADSTRTIPMTPELAEMLARARAEWKRLEEAGTPYWCVHRDREVDDPSAYWREDAYEPGDPGYDGIHRKYGVLCADCGGYIQEG